MAKQLSARPPRLPEDVIEEKTRAVNMALLDAYKKTAEFLNNGRFNYIVIGGIAASTLGEARATVDVDIDIAIDRKGVSALLEKLKKAGFQFSVKRCLETAQQKGVFQISLDNYHIDFIIASTELEINACSRRHEISLHGIKAFFPTIEDMVLLKLVPGRTKDIADVESLISCHKNKLDEEYLKTWAMRLCDEAEDMRIWNQLKKMLDEK